MDWYEDWYEGFPILIIDDELGADNAGGRALRAIVAELQRMHLSTIEALTASDGMSAFLSHADISCVLLDWDLGLETPGASPGPADLVANIRARNKKISLFLLTDRVSVKDIPLEVVREIDGYIWKTEDTPYFIAGRIEYAVKEYLSQVLPPFFRELVNYVDEYKYSWHTPGHSGGVAFLKSPVGRVFSEFFGERVLRADLSVSVPELGSLLEHTGVVGDAERRAARVFGADRTYFVTNGTSTSNKIVFHGCITPGDIVLVDRNCHKSILHAIIMTRGIPVYLNPTRNGFGIIGPIHRDEFEQSTVNKKMANSKLVPDSSPKRAKLAVITNSTYDGLCYNAEMLKEKLRHVVKNILFDEAWYGYARFHSLYAGRYGMSGNAAAHSPTIFATQSTHKVLAALSQGSMIHLKEGEKPVEHQRFNEAFMMHTSTSPQYGIIASLDVAAKMMEDESGKFLVEEAMEEAITFRKKMAELHKEITGSKDETPWWFRVWQAEKARVGNGIEAEIERLTDEVLKEDPECWTLRPDEGWHGFGNLEKDYVLLDPLKVTILTPGISDGGQMQEWGIPAAVVTSFMRSRGVVVEKTGFYSFLVLFTIGITKGKSGTLLAELFEFKRLYDENAPLEDVFPELVGEYPERYGKLRLQEFARDMHEYLKRQNITNIIRDIYAEPPEPTVIPAAAYDQLVRGNVEQLGLADLEGRIPAVMVVPYPPGIPVIMPGEKFTRGTEKIIEYLSLCQDFDNRYPGFENETHGITIQEDKENKKAYYIYCLAGEYSMHP
jgi:arginine decarboxylase